MAAVTVGHGFSFDIPAKGLEGNTIVIQTMSPKPIGGMNLTLEKSKSPLAFQLRAGGPNGRFYDAQVVVRVLARGPGALASRYAEDDTPVTGQPWAMDMLEGHPPASAVPLDVRGLSPDLIRAWRYRNHYYIRTGYTIVNPQPNVLGYGEAVGLYEIPQASVVLISADGRTRSIYLDDR